MSMGKKRRMASRIREWMMEYAYLVTLGAVIAVIAGGAVYTSHMQAQRDVQAAAGAPETQTSAGPEATASAEITPLPTIAPPQVRYQALAAGVGTVWPASGRIVRAYDAERPVLWEALSCVQVHAGIDIAAQAGESIRCAMDGVVSRTALDPLWGWRVHVAHTDGSEAVYAGLESCDVAAEQVVTRGQQLGVLLERIPCEAEMEPHLHMELRRSGALCDPALILPER